jgi:hypothetical protein
MDDDVADNSDSHASSEMSQCWSDHDLMKNLLRESLEREKMLRRRLDKEILKNDQLRMELEIEKKKKIIVKG